MSNVLRSSITWICAAFLVIAGFFLITEHTAHLFGILPWLFLLACPLLHMLSHRGHGRHPHPGDGHDHTAPQEKGGTP